MTIPPILVSTARNGWKWQWVQLMNKLAPADSKGNFSRIPSQHQNATTLEKKELLNREKENLPSLIIGRSCPWAHRTWIMYEIRELKETLNIIFAKSDHNSGAWLIEPSWLNCDALIQLYRLCQAPPNHRATVPVLIDPISNKSQGPNLLGNESAQLIEVLNEWPSDRSSPNLFQKEQQGEIKKWQSLCQVSINDGVYKCGFARNQYAYEKASKELFDSLNLIEKQLASKGPWICGENLTLADVSLFPTLIRWESVYQPLFGCSQEPLWGFAKIWQWRKNFYNIPGIKDTCNSEQWRHDYFGALFPLNPSNIIPKGPSLEKIINGEISS